MCRIHGPLCFNSLFGFESLNQNFTKFRNQYSHQTVLEMFDLKAFTYQISVKCTDNPQYLDGILYRKTRRDVFYLKEKKVFGYIVKRTDNQLLYVNIQTHKVAKFETSDTVIPVLVIRKPSSVILQPTTPLIKYFTL